MDDLTFWNVRAQKYASLDWAKKGDFLQAFLQAGRFQKEETILDVGTGTGIIGKTIAPFVKKVVGIDISDEMLKQAESSGTPNMSFRQMDIAKMPFSEGEFDKVTARMVFHGLVDNAPQAMQECQRVLKEGGEMIFAEGVPPSEHVKSFFTKVFKLKEKRITFMPEDLVTLMREAGFSRVNQMFHFVRQTSIRNWIENSGLPTLIQNKILQMHFDLDEQGKKDYNMTVTSDDCLIDMKFAILVGQK